MSSEAGVYAPQIGGYNAFVPHALPPNDLDLKGLTRLISEAEIAIGRLDGIARVVPDPDLFVYMYVRREAVLSSQIEGTQATLMDVLEYEAQLNTNSERNDVYEIVNYINALKLGQTLLKELPISRRLLCEVHAVLLSGTRGGEQSKTPGEFRNSQNWIGGPSPQLAQFVPPPAETLTRVFADLENFLHAQDNISPLVRIGLAHAQFETIHPFLDGNGRLGRLLVTLWLMHEQILQQPLLYISLFLKANRAEYMRRLQATRDGDWTSWLSFFLTAIRDTATQATETASKMNVLRNELNVKIRTELPTKLATAQKLLDSLYTEPVVSSARAQHATKSSATSTNGLLDEFIRLGILRETTGKKRNRIYAFQPYLDLFA